MPDDADPIRRAKAQVNYWREQRERMVAETRFSKCTPAELVRIAETKRDLQGRPLHDGADIMALDDAWFDTFGEQLCQPVVDGEDAHAGEKAEPIPLDQHPLLSVPDDALLRPRDVMRLFGYSKSTLTRHATSGKFPSPQRAAPGQRFVGWPARQLKAWLQSGGGTVH